MVEVGSQISGQVKELYADFNSPVTQGQVIARVEPEIYEAKLAQAQAELEMAETMVSVQRAQIERDRRPMENAKAAEEVRQGADDARRGGARRRDAGSGAQAPARATITLLLGREIGSGSRTCTDRRRRR